MTDEQIIKALECCDRTTNKGCPSCPLFEYYGEQTCITVMSNKVLDLINRQKVEIEKLQDKIHKMFEYKVEVSYNRA